MLEVGAPIAPPGVPPYGLVWWTGTLTHLVTWIIAGAASYMTVQHAEDMHIFEELAMLGFCAIVLTILSVGVAALCSCGPAPPAQVGGTFMGMVFSTVALFAHVGLVLDARDARYLARGILQNATAVDPTVLSSSDYYDVQAALIATILGYMILMYFGKVTIENVGKHLKDYYYGQPVVYAVSRPSY